MRWGPFLLQYLESNPKFPLKTRQEVWFPSCNSRGPRDPRHNSWWKPSFPPLLEKSPVCPTSCGHEGPFPSSAQEESQLPLAPQEEACVTNWISSGTPWILLQGKRTPDKSWFPCTGCNGTVSIPSQQDGRPVAQAYPLEKAQIPRLNSTRGLIPLWKLERNAEFHASTPDEAWLPSWTLIKSPRSLSPQERNTGFSWLKSRHGPVCRQRLKRNPDVSLTTRKETLPLWGNTSWSLRSPWQLERNPKLPATTREKTRDSPLNVRWGPFPEQCLQRNPTFPLETRKGTWHPWCNSGRSPKYPSPLERNTEFHATTQEEPRFPPPQLEMRVDSPASLGKESGRCRRPSRGGRSHLETRAHPRELCLNSKRPWFPHPLQISLIPLHGLDWNPENWLKTRKEVWQPRGTLRKSPRPLCPLERKTDTPFTPREGSGLPCLDTRRGLTPLLKLHRKPEIHVRTGEEPWGSGLNSRWGPMPLHWLERNPERRLATRTETWLSWGNTRGSVRSTSQLERSPQIPAKPQGKPRDSPLNARWGPFPLQRLERNPTFPPETRNGIRHPLWNSRSSPTYPSSLERNTEFPGTPQSEPLCPSSSRDEGRFPCFDWKGILTFLSHLKRWPVSHWNLTRTFVGRVTIPKTLISPSTWDKAWCPCTDLNGTPRIKSQHKGALTPQVHPPEKAAVSKSNLTRDLTHHSQLERQAEFHASTQDEA